MSVLLVLQMRVLARALWVPLFQMSLHRRESPRVQRLPLGVLLRHHPEAWALLGLLLLLLLLHLLGALDHCHWAWRQRRR